MQGAVRSPGVRSTRMSPGMPADHRRAGLTAISRAHDRAAVLTPFSPPIPDPLRAAQALSSRGRAIVHREPTKQPSCGKQTAAPGARALATGASGKRPWHRPSSSRPRDRSKRFFRSRDRSARVVRGRALEPGHAAQVWHRFGDLRAGEVLDDGLLAGHVIGPVPDFAEDHGTVGRREAAGGQPSAICATVHRSSGLISRCFARNERT